jgi:hypothetical protein
MRSLRRCCRDGIGHGGTKGGEVVWFGLIDEDVAIGEKQDPLFGAGFPESSNDLEGGEGFAGAGGHDEDEAVAALGDRFEGLVDGVDLVVAGQFAAAVAVVVLGDQVSTIVGDAFVAAVFADLGVEVPASGGEGRGDVFGTDVAFSQVFFVEHGEERSRVMLLF